MHFLELMIIAFIGAFVFWVVVVPGVGLALGAWLDKDDSEAYPRDEMKLPMGDDHEGGRP